MQLDNMKSGIGRPAPTGVRRNSEVALFATQEGRLTTQGVGR
ncbi:hypothetical protein [Planococcus donghaensis]